MKNAMQLKAIIKNISKEKSISAQFVMQNFMLERLLERISVSKYKSNFILKSKYMDLKNEIDRQITIIREKVGHFKVQNQKNMVGMH